MKIRRLAAVLLAVATGTSLLAGGCGDKIDGNAAFATLDDVTIPMGVANFAAKYQQAMFDSYYMSYFGEDMWDSDLYGNGNTLTEDVKNDVAEELQEMYLLQAHMEDYDVAVSDEEEEAIGQAVDDFIADNSKDAVKQIGAEDKEYAVELLRLYTIRSKMHASIVAEADITVSDEEAAQRTFSYVEIDTDGYYDDDSNYVEYTEEEKEGLKASAEAIAAAEDFDQAASDAGQTVSTESYGSAEDEDASMDTAVLEEADKLAEGQISGVVETDSAYYVLRLDSEYDEEATESNRESLISEREEDYYDDILSGWKDECTWTINEEEWAKVTFEDHFAMPEDTEELTEDEDGAGTESISGTEGVSEDTESVFDTESISDTEG